MLIYSFSLDHIVSWCCCCCCCLLFAFIIFISDFSFCMCVCVFALLFMKMSKLFSLIVLFVCFLLLLLFVTCILLWMAFPLSRHQMCTNTHMRACQLKARERESERTRECANNSCTIAVDARCVRVTRRRKIC